MAAEVMLALGDGPDAYTFSIGQSAYDSLRRTTSWRWSSLVRAGRAPSRQFVGPGDDQIVLNGVIYPRVNRDLNQLPRMREEAGKGTPLLLVDGFGRTDMGYWCIVSIEESQSTIVQSGVPRRIDFSMTLIAYGEASLAV